MITLLKTKSVIPNLCRPQFSVGRMPERLHPAEVVAFELKRRLAGDAGSIAADQIIRTLVVLLF